MKEWLNYLRLEWRLLLGGKMLWILLAAGVFHYVLVQIAIASENHSLTEGFTAYDAQFMQNLYILPFSIASVLIGVHVMRRERLYQFADIERSLPIRPGRWLAARIFVIILPFVLLNIVPGVLWLVTSGVLPISLAVRAEYFLFLISFSIPFLFKFILGCLIGTMIRNRTAYFVGLIVWMIVNYGMAAVLKHVSVPVARLIMLMPNTFLYDYYHLFWGYLEPALLWQHWGLYAGLAILLALWAVWMWYRQRLQTNPIRTMLIIGVAAVLLSGSSAYATVHTLQSRIDRYEHQMAMITQDVELPSAPARYTIRSYDMDVKLGRDEQLEVAVRMEVIPAEPLQTLLFTLHHEYELIGEVMVDGHPAPYMRELNRLTVELERSIEPDHAATVLMHYQGEIQDWQLEGAGRLASLQPLYLATARRIYMPAHLGWYPLAGHVALQSVREDRLYPSAPYILNNYTPTGSSAFTIRLDYPAGIEIYSNLEVVQREVAGGRQTIHLHALQAAGAMLIGGPFQAVSSGAHTMIASHYVRQERLLSLLDTAVQHEQHILTMLKVDHLVPAAHFHILRPGFRSIFILGRDVSNGNFSGVTMDSMSNNFRLRYQITESVMDKRDLWSQQTDPYSRRLFALALTVQSMELGSADYTQQYRFAFGLDQADAEQLEQARKGWSAEEWQEAIRQMYRQLRERPEEKLSLLNIRLSGQEG